jgi:signal peptidase I
MNFALILFLLLVVTGIAWLLDKLIFAPRRRVQAQARVAAWEQEQIARGASIEPASRRAVEETAQRQPLWLEYTAGLFPVILVVFFLRSFIAEPFKIPSGSMLPTLLVGDLILVNKFTYGVRLPVIHTKILGSGQPARGDVMVFRYPHDTSLDYIKRVVGLPGDKIVFKNNKLEINNSPVPLQSAGEFYDVDRVSYHKQYSEKLGDIDHKILTELEKTSSITPMDFALKEQCKYERYEMSCTVPAGHFFVMGDNRDNSQDSRFWGFVPEANIVGKAFFIWMNLSNPGRIGRFH